MKDEERSTKKIRHFSKELVLYPEDPSFRIKSSWPVYHMENHGEGEPDLKLSDNLVV